MAQPLPASPPNYRMIRFLGKGSFSCVWEAEDLRTHNIVALKQIPLTRMTSSLQQQLAREIQLHSSLSHHPNLVKLYDFFLFPEEGPGQAIYLVLELVTGPDLFEAAARRRIAEDIAQRLARMAVAGMLALSQLNIVHRDLKPANMLLTSPDLGSAVLKICDFGMAKRLEDSEMTATVAGTPYYIAPEIARRIPYGKPADIWSLGAIFFELMAGKPPIPAENILALFTTLSDPHLQVDFTPLRHVSPLGLSLIQQMLDPDPRSRLTIQQVAQHPWIAIPIEPEMPLSSSPSSSPSSTAATGAATSSPTSSRRPVGMEAAEPMPADLATITSEYTRALALADVAQACVHRGALHQGLALYTLALTAIETVIACRPPMELAVAARRDKTSFLVRAESLHRNCGDSCSTPITTSATGIAQWIFNFAIELGKLAASDEALGRVDQAASRYQKALALLFHLQNTTQQHAEPLREIIAQFQQRHEEVSSH